MFLVVQYTGCILLGDLLTQWTSDCWTTLVQTQIFHIFCCITGLIKPAPVTNVTLNSLVYDPVADNSPLDEIKLTVSWIPPSGG